MRTVPVVDVLLVILEFAGLFVATWIAWFAVVTAYQILTRRTEGRHRWSLQEPALTTTENLGHSSFPGTNGSVDGAV
jgi:hypothetical protein